MVKTMTIATIDIGGTGIKFASLTPDGKILDKTSIPTPETLEDLLAWLDQHLSEQDYSGDCYERSRRGQSRDRCD